MPRAVVVGAVVLLLAGCIAPPAGPVGRADPARAGASPQEIFAGICVSFTKKSATTTSILPTKRKRWGLTGMNCMPVTLRSWPKRAQRKTFSDWRACSCQNCGTGT